MMSAPIGYELSRAARHAAVDARAQEHILEILAQAKAARAAINRGAAQKLRRIEERFWMV